METPAGKKGIDDAAARLRAIVLGMDDGALIGSEDALLARLGCSRSTVRQVARLLEREGLLRVRRGINGGYFGARPDAETIGGTVSAYLETLNLGAQDVTLVASALWVEVLRKAAAARDEGLRDALAAIHPRVAALPDDAPYARLRTLEDESRAAIFALADARYIELIFGINIAFASRSFGPRPVIGDAADRRFVRAWRNAKLMELNAIAARDVELAGLAARHLRGIWNARVWPSEGAACDRAGSA